MDDGDKCDSKVCRLCLGTADVTVPIGRHAKSASIVEKIHYCTSLNVKVGDDLPQNICTACAENLNLLYNFKSKAISCDLELSKNVHKDISFTYTQVSDDPLNMTFQLQLEEQDITTHVGDSCVYNIVDGDELTIEPVNTIHDSDNTKTDKNNSSMNESLNYANDQKLGVITNKLNGNLKSCRDSKTSSKENNTTDDLKRSLTRSLVEDEKYKPKKIKTENDIDNEKPMLIVKNGKVVYICRICTFEAESMALLLSHRARIHSDNVGGFQCPQCSTYYRTPGLLKRHTSLHHSVLHICNSCDKKFPNKQSLERHVHAHHNITPLEFQCVKCNAYFDTMDKMEDHLVVHYTNPTSTFTCNYCDRSFTTFAAKNKHIDLEHLIEIECSICHVVLPTKEAMDKHNNSVHQPKKTGNKMYACTSCGKSFSTIKEVLKHRETHKSN